MRITKLYIKKYKNLEELNWEINPNYPVTAIVGKNASGKSNLLAAMMEIFGQCYNYAQKKKVNSSKFEFSITYTTQYKGDDIDVTFKYEHKKHSLYRNGNQNDAIQDIGVLPEKIFTYYAGESKRFENIIKDYQAVGLFTFLFPQENQFILFSLFSSSLESVKETLKEQFHILSLHEVTLTIQNPYQKIKEFKGKPNFQNFWGAYPALEQFYRELESMSSNTHKKAVYSNGKLELTIKGADLKQLTEEGRYEYDLLTLLQWSFGLGFIRGIDNFSFQKENVDELIGFEDLSEGERQRIGLLGAFSVYQGKETLFILDEPDAFAHPRWQWEFVPDIEKAIGENNFQHVIFATHSPIVLSSLIEPAYMMEAGEIHQMNKTFGNTVNETLAEQDIPSRKGELADSLKEYLVLIQEGAAQSEEAKNLRLMLEDVLGKSHPQLQDADDLIAFYE